MDYCNFTGDELEFLLGEQLRAERLRKNLTMEDVATLAGVSVNTVRSLEAERGGRVESLVRVARALGRLAWLQSFDPVVKISPLQIAAGKRKRRRASRSLLKAGGGKGWPRKPCYTRSGRRARMRLE